MSILKISGERTTPDFIEEDFISAIETALNRSVYYRDKCVEIRRISQADENELGYDGVLNTTGRLWLKVILPLLKPSTKKP